MKKSIIINIISWLGISLLLFFYLRFHLFLQNIVFFQSVLLLHIVPQLILTSFQKFLQYMLLFPQSAYFELLFLCLFLALQVNCKIGLCMVHIIPLHFLCLLQVVLMLQSFPLLHLEAYSFSSFLLLLFFSYLQFILSF